MTSTSSKSLVRGGARAAATAGLALALALSATPTTAPAIAAAFSPATAEAVEAASDVAIRGVDTTTLTGDSFDIATAIGLGGNTLYADVTVNGRVVTSDLAYTYDDADDEAGMVQLKTSLATLAKYSGNVTVSFYGEKTAERASDAAALYTANVYVVAAVDADGNLLGDDVASAAVGLRTCAGTATSGFQAPTLIVRNGVTYRRSSTTPTLGADGVLRVTYAQTATSGISAQVNYVDQSGNLLKTDDLGTIAEDQVITYTPLKELTSGDKTYVPLTSSTLAPTLTYANPTLTITCAERRAASTDKTSVAIKYVTTDDATGATRQLMADTVEVGVGGYNYAPAKTFSQARDGSVIRYTLTGATDSNGNTYTADQAASLSLTYSGATTYTLSYSKENLQLSYSVSYALVAPDDNGNLSVSVDSTTSYDFNETTDATVDLPATIDRAGHTYKLSGSATQLTYGWSDLQSGRLMSDTVYYVRDDVQAPEAYDVTVRYVDVSTGAELGSTTLTCDPAGDALSIEGPESLDVNGTTYQRLSGQESALTHRYYAPYRTYTIYYGQPSVIAQGNTTVTRTQIIDGGVTYYTIDATTGTVSTQASNAGGLATTTPYTTVVSNASADGQTDGDASDASADSDAADATGEQSSDALAPNGNSAAEERIDEDETPLAEGESNKATSPALLAGVVAVLIAAVAGIVAFVLKRNSDKKEA